MCGVTGFLARNGAAAAEDLRAIVGHMAATLHHRGPDDGGAWVDPAAGIALGFRRLAILDLTPSGHQPMESRSGRYVIAFNGEVYNFEQIREELRAGAPDLAFRGTSDTETMLSAFEAWGLAPAIRRFVGMFAFALWDRQERTLHLVRDRVGVKPLYYAWSGGMLLFGSELKSLLAHPGWAPDVDRDALALFLRHGYVPGPYSIYQGVHKLPPGTILTVRDGDRPDAVPVPYWSALETATDGLANGFHGTEHEAVDHLDALLRDSVRLRMVADVPLGVFLSGGIDSSTVVALMQALSSRPVRTFTIGFQDDRFNEARDAKAVACHLGTEHTELYVTSAEAMSVIPKLPALYDEPFADSSQIPTYLVSALARQSVTVSLSGDGGDEVFGGYNRYFVGPPLWDRIRRMPRSLRSVAASAVRRLPPAALELMFRLASPALPRHLRDRDPVPRLLSVAHLLDADSPLAFYRSLVSRRNDPRRLMPGCAALPTALQDAAGWDLLPDLLHRMAYMDTITYLPDDILVKVDRASMGVSLEAREPLLDHRIIEFAWRLPASLKTRGGQGKWVLRQVLYRYVPQSLLERPKKGFGVPIGSWMRGPLKEWASELLSPERVRREGYFEAREVSRLWREHITGRADWTYELWDILMFQAWLEQQCRRPA